MIARVPQVKASNNRPGNRGTWAAEVMRDPFARQARGASAAAATWGACRGSWETWSGPAGRTAVLCACTALPSLVSFTSRSWGGAFSRGLGCPVDRLYREKPEVPSSHSAWPCPPCSRGSRPGPESPGQSVLGAEAGGSGKASRAWTEAGGMLRDQRVFSGQGGAWAPIQGPVALRLCCLLWPPLCACRKYLRDADRQVLAQRAFILTVKVLEDTLSELAEVRLWPLSSPRPRPRPPVK